MIGPIVLQDCGVRRRAQGTENDHDLFLYMLFSLSYMASTLLHIYFGSPYPHHLILLFLFLFFLSS